MARELVIHNAVYRAAEKRMEILFIASEFRTLTTTVVVTDKDTGEEVSRSEETKKKVLAGFGETVYCPDADEKRDKGQPHTHAAMTCLLSHPEYAAKKKQVADALNAWKVDVGPVDATPEERKIE